MLLLSNIDLPTMYEKTFVKEGESYFNSVISPTFTCLSMKILFKIKLLFFFEILDGARFGRAISILVYSRVYLHLLRSIG